MANSEEIAYWNDEAGSRWCTLQERIDRAFAPLSSAALGAAAFQPAETVSFVRADASNHSFGG